MYIVILPTSYPNVYNQNSSIFIQDQVEALIKDGQNISVIGAIPISFKEILKKKFLKFGTFKYEKNGVNVNLFLFPSIPKLKFFNQFIRIQINKYLLKKYFLTNFIDLIHIHNSKAGEAALWMKKKFNVPYLITEHSSGYARNLISKKEIKSYREIYESASYRIAVSKKFCEILEKIFNVQFNYIPNIVNTDYFLSIEKKTTKNFKFINIANLYENKNQILLIRAFAKSFYENKNIKLLILGGGPEYNNLKSEIKKLNMENQIKLYGFVKREKVLNELQKSDVFILSSKYETFGVVVIEAMSCGLPVIATKCGGPESIIENGNLGVLVENDKFEELSKAMKDIYKCKYKYSKNIIRNYILENFSEKIITNKLIKIYEFIIKNERLK